MSAGGRRCLQGKGRHGRLHGGHHDRAAARCLTADQIAEEAELFSFGTNDLTQTTFGISRDDINNFLPAYLKHGIFKQDPFATLDQAGVGQLVKMATAKGRNTRPT